MTKIFVNATPSKYTGEHAVIMAAEIIRNDGILAPKGLWVPADYIPAGLCEIYTQAGVRYWGKR